MNSHTLFIQKRSIRAGAQTSLARMIDSEPFKKLKPAVLLGSEGWLAQHLRERHVPFFIVPFPSPRALSVRLFGLQSFAAKTHALFQDAGIHVSAIVANDHQECPLALALSARSGGVPVLGVLRTPGMTRRDFEKYHCNRCDGLMGEGTELNHRLHAWTDQDPALFEEGFCEHEFHPPVPRTPVFPTRILVIGSEDPRKGFSDFIDALNLLESRHPDFPGLQCDFTGTRPAELGRSLTHPSRSRLTFLGRVDGFANLVRDYPLAIHPSRAETFGMAPIEAMLAGVPTLVSCTGVLGSLPLPTAWVFSPHSPIDIAEHLAELWQRWGENAIDLAAMQQYIHSCYHIDRTAAALRDALIRIDGAPSLQ